jgi:hypothetical protein
MALTKQPKRRHRFALPAHSKLRRLTSPITTRKLKLYAEIESRQWIDD